MEIRNQAPVLTPSAPVVTVAPKATASVDQPLAQIPTQDTVHFSTRSSGMPTARISFAENTAPDTQAKTEFGSAVQVDASNHKEMKTLLGYFSMTSDQERQIQAAENRAFDRFMSNGYSPERGSIQAKIRQSSFDTYNPGYSALNNSTLTINEGEKGQIKDALQKYGEDVASIAVTGRSRRDLQRHLEDKFFITIFDRDKEEFQDYFKGGFQNFAADQTSQMSAEQVTATPVTPSASVSTESTPVALPVADQEQYKWRFVRPRVGVNVRGLDFKKLTVKPKIDLLQVRGPAQTEVRVTANVPFEMSGKVLPEAEITARRMFNAKPGEYGSLTQNVYGETRSNYNFEEQRLEATLGVRKQISPDSSMGLYGLYSQTFNNLDVKDLGVGVSYQSRFD
ncbi:hypothetical protein COW36_13140 [bacterium (Candidatus Blackallbacteria) CG17_big_fil_post_rev_8_21_14_2_50_48_46]|uniref:Uncharacterized protein n=1 Tax=bacterium (Candidatus Blackallbacteria) CG17_big_fil_post_rev_8_21_14_2_50_48_46 TaxID=2014261 RepID=A0A2M7G585_9BACT|nr:MAG: hypothetical protein COW64_02130 [bacterium (Candidatus Blackallbacteria) CG18_big_fil_WC_8_21_14_2_50_49_26]PIW16704.1 MAG: hypothetical protein COW36_13140 [bacterium (Candidatus Blackallbacteria) CG17_big_fil_post_rev_8_21_14_2_50_48_46]PIW46210.1 MAG: hypothetical protein COW20_18390 [bacterium (Candidatus Blackallbacteria) CG13_big_fil_rev_8_21_14_2_50_49_14]